MYKTSIVTFRSCQHAPVADSLGVCACFNADPREELQLQPQTNISLHSDATSACLCDFLLQQRPSIRKLLVVLMVDISEFQFWGIKPLQSDGAVRPQHHMIVAARTIFLARQIE